MPPPRGMLQPEEVAGTDQANKMGQVCGKGSCHEMQDLLYIEEMLRQAPAAVLYVLHATEQAAAVLQQACC